MNYLQIAADMLADDEGRPWSGDVSCVNTDLAYELLSIENMTAKVSGKLISRQAIAVAIVNWKARNENVEAYKEG